MPVQACRYRFPCERSRSWHATLRKHGFAVCTLQTAFECLSKVWPQLHLAAEGAAVGVPGQRLSCDFSYGNINTQSSANVMQGCSDKGPTQQLSRLVPFTATCSYQSYNAVHTKDCTCQWRHSSYLLWLTSMYGLFMNGCLVVKNSERKSVLTKTTSPGFTSLELQEDPCGLLVSSKTWSAIDLKVSPLKMGAWLTRDRTGNSWREQNSS